MKSPGSFSILAALLLIFISCSSAWPWPESLENNFDALILRRQDDDQSATSVTDKASITPAADSAAASETAEASATDKNDNDAAASETVAASGSGRNSTKSQTGTKTTSTKTTPIDPRLPPGGISLITPAAIDGIQYYRVGDFVTFAWNYTSLSVTPSAIDVLASCAVNQATYTISSNMSVEETGAVTWDTGEYYATATNPFPVASYTLIIHDAAKDVTDVPSAGYLGAYEQYVFGMYTP